MKGKVTEEDLENASQLGNLQNNIVNLLEAERDFREDIASIDRQLVKARQDALKATDQTVGLAKAERQAKEQQVNIEAALTKQKQAILKLEESINKLGPKGNKNLRQKLVEEKKLAVAKSESLQKDVDALDIDLLDIQNLRTKNKLIQQAGDTFSVAADGALSIADNLKAGVEAIPGGATLSRLMGLDDLGERLEDVASAGAGAYIGALEQGLPPAQASAAAMQAMSTSIKAILSPALLVAAAFAGLFLVFKGISDEAKKLAEETGITFAQAKKLNQEARNVQSSFSTTLATVEDITAVQKEQLDLLGSTALINTEIAGAVAETGRAFGYSAQTAGQVQNALMLAGAEQREAAEIQQQTNKRALQEGLNVAAVQKDIAENAKGALKFLGGSPEKLAEAAIQAGKLGVNLATLTKVADALLDIEGSLTAQFEFQALSGKEINLDLARQKALRGDIAGATEEALKTIESTAELDQMGVFAQEALAKATGVSVEELRKSLTIREKLGELDDEAKAAAANLGLSAAQLADMSADELQNRLAQQQSLDKAGAAFDSIKAQLTNALLPLAEAFGQVFNILSPVLKIIGFAFKTIGFILTPIAMLVEGIVDSFSALGNILTGNIEQLGTVQIIMGAIAGIATAYYLTKVATNAAETIGVALGKKSLRNRIKDSAAAITGAVGQIFKSFGNIPFGLGIPLAIAAVGGMIGLISSAASKAGDVASPAKGKTQISTKEGGLFELSKNDDVAAGPGILSTLKNAISGNEDEGPGVLSKLMSASPIGMAANALGGLFGGGDDSGGTKSDNEALMAKLDELIMAAKTPPPVYIGPKAVTELASVLNLNDSFQTSPQINGGD